MLRFSLPVDRRVPHTRCEKGHPEGDPPLERGRNGKMDRRRGKALSVPPMREQTLPGRSALRQLQDRCQSGLREGTHPDFSPEHRDAGRDTTIKRDSGGPFSVRPSIGRWEISKDILGLDEAGPIRLAVHPPCGKFLPRPDSHFLACRNQWHA